MSKPFDKNRVAKLIAEAILLSSVNFSIGSVEMSSKYSVANFSTSPEVLQSAANALVDYTKIGVIWSIGVMLLLYSKFGFWGVVAGLVSNLIIMLWIWLSYVKVFKDCAKKHNLPMPKYNFFNMNIAN